MQPIVDTFIAPPCHEQIVIIADNEHFLLINKPSGLLSLSGKHPANLDSVHHRLVKQYPECTLVHRLDLGTSGIMVVAKNKTINALLCKQFSERKVLKRYTALLAGDVLKESGEIVLPIAKDKPNFPLMKICQQEGKPAHSIYQVLSREHYSNTLEQDAVKYSTESSNLQHDCNRSTMAQIGSPAVSSQVTRVELTPKTGRTHQLRIHCQQIGHPIIGCDLYGTEFSHQLAPRLMLHATRLEFDHPITGERVLGFSACPF
ncbi:RluA family pseudouridine synthase [Shewanella youngdeokensis]|uniref:RluA family pseudouridine synthase n=1 Tax=Shewanella youngdeokensis TaxID=2999068 RepID=A0ABZ0K4A5_9GAMM|nr:RluA family pseudouridine synthase [Shewanella sp. DAU334]